MYHHYRNSPDVRKSFGLFCGWMFLTVFSSLPLSASELRPKPTPPPADPQIQLRGWFKQNPNVEWIGAGTITEVHVNKISKNAAEMN